MSIVSGDIRLIPDPVDRFVAFIAERESIRVNKEVLKRDPAVWTEDPILKEYRFCNVRREDDRVTRWIAKNWREPHQGDKDIWFAMVVARFINWPDTLESIGFPVPWDLVSFLASMNDRKRTGQKMYTGAYMVRADREHKNKFEYQEKVVFTPMWEARERLRPRNMDTLNSYHMLLGQFHGLGSFMAAQIVADLKYVAPLSRASDWASFAASGPGSRRGLNLVLGKHHDASWPSETVWRMDLGRLRDAVDEKLNWGNPLHAQDVQNCLCEFDKYERVRLGQGKPRSRYTSHDK